MIMYNTDGDIDLEHRCLRSAQGRVDVVIVILFRLTDADLLPLTENGMTIVRVGGLVQNQERVAEKWYAFRHAKTIVCSTAE